MSGIDWDRLKMLEGGAVTPAAWNEMLRLVKRCYVAQVIGGERRDVGPHTVVDVSKARGAGVRRARFEVFWRNDEEGDRRVFVAPGVVRWRWKTYGLRITQEDVTVEESGSFSWFDLVPEVDEAALVAPAPVGDIDNAGETLYLRVVSDDDLIPQSADFVWAAEPPEDVHFVEEEENLTHFALASMTAEGKLVPVWQGDIMLPITQVVDLSTDVEPE